MYRLSPELLIAAAGSMVSVGAGSDVTLDDNSSAEHGANASWDVRFIEKCGFWSHFDYGVDCSSWPFPRGLTLDELARYAKASHIIHDEPEPGDIFLQYSSQRREYIHAGIVIGTGDRGRYSLHRSYVDVRTIEGDTDADGMRCGGRALRVRRRLLPSHGDCFVRWRDLPPFSTRSAS